MKQSQVRKQYRSKEYHASAEDDGCAVPSPATARPTTASGEPCTVLNALDDLHMAVQQALSWVDLERTLDKAQLAFTVGSLSHEAVEQLAVYAGRQARVLPEGRLSGVHSKAEQAEP